MSADIDDDMFLSKFLNKEIKANSTSVFDLFYLCIPTD